MCALQRLPYGQYVLHATLHEQYGVFPNSHVYLLVCLLVTDSERESRIEKKKLNH